ncbi:hypothetical protein [Crenalkalicoccus roseus]|uniref:hypothetical protein n=1 Tax=Crenalkalicoccus roseus TaxID=1485588 RepID=UPI0010822E59|nr:hypothetical protein [Crenalkalicoccus roseus]
MGEVLEFYRRCAALRQRFQDAALRTVPMPKLLEQARRLGLPVTEALAQIPDADLAFAFDLAVHTALPGRSRAIERVARQHRGAGEEEALVLRGLERAWFSVFRVLGPHPEAGLLLEDALLGGEAWVMDEALAESAPAGTVLATRLARVRGFAITCGAVAPLDEAILAGFRRALAGAGTPPAEMAADPRFALLIYQRALGFHLSDPDAEG